MKKPAQKRLLDWFKENQRPFPWRMSQDPYRVWISETMLQQTTSQAVIPYFERFVARFPTLKDLAASSLEDVYAQWAGLGYYSRARNLHRAAQQLMQNGFPQTFEKLIEYPGFGPYTARAVASIAFGENVGVLDGNVIRVLSRYEGKAYEWWRSGDRKALQASADKTVEGVAANEMNQALMELGSTICTPQSPSCFLCPIRSSCQAYATDRIQSLPLKKPRKALEIWEWKPEIYIRRGQVAFIKNDYAPFLKGQWILPGFVARQKKRPGRFDFRHGITHHDIYVTVPQNASKILDSTKGRATWFNINGIETKIPLALIKKALVAFQKHQSQRHGPSPSDS